MKLIGVDELKTYLIITDPNVDEAMDLVLTQVTGQIEMELGYPLLRGARTERIHPIGLFDGYSFYLHNLPVVAGSPITLVNAERTYIHNTDFIVDAETGKLSLIIATPLTYYDYPSIIVTYTSGYLESEDEEGLLAGVPESLRRACMQQAAYEYKHKEDLGLAGVSMAGASVQLAPAK